MSRVIFPEEEARKIVAVLGLARTVGFRAKIFAAKDRANHQYDVALRANGEVRVLSIFGPERTYESLETFAQINGVSGAKV